ncbi:MAG: apolipoprotein N-acyltransferase [Deltaproteobacteria bacterium]|nr:MAG: apolipoprotein N-acyltransferase [Deltaproteobacteria bacterium]
MSASPAPHIGVRIAVVLAAAATLSILAPPVNLHWLHWVAYLPMFWALRAETPRANRWLAFLYGTFGVGLIFRWIMESILHFSNLPTPVAWFTLLLFSVVFGLTHLVLWPSVHPLRKWLGDWWMVVIPSLQVGLELLSMYVFLFPYNHGVSQYRFPYTWQLASVTGVWGLTWLVFFVNCTLAEAMYRRREGNKELPIPWMSAAATLLALVIAFGAWRFHRLESELQAAPEIKVAQIQTDITMQHRMSEGRKKAFDIWVSETETLIDQTEPGDVDLVVWSEGSSPYNVHEGRANRIISDLASRGGFELIVGGGTFERGATPDDYTAYNSLYLFGREGDILGRYDKNVPLPFGEYLPLANVFPILREWIKGPGNFRAGEGAEVVVGKTIRYAPPICYEAILPYMCARFDRPDLFINVTNDAWFGDTAAPHQHAMLAAVRSVELGVPMVRAGYTGISMVIEPHGVIHSETRPFERENRVIGVRMKTFPTLYSRLGDWFAWLSAVVAVAGIVIARRRSLDTAKDVS